MRTPLKIDKPIRLIELFAGIGAQAKALTRLGADFEHYRICEFDKYAIKSYNTVHGTNFDTSDITKITANDLGIVDTDKYCYIMTYSFPCQDLSLAGKGKGMAKGENTRSGLLWEVERLLNECTELPQILLMENVTQVHGKNNKEHFDAWIEFLESKGYSNYWKDLNAKNFGVPQNRNRTFMVSVLGNYTYEFPEEFPLELRLKDMLEDSVDEKFYLSSEQIGKIVNWKAQQKPFERVNGNNSIVQTITARGAGENHSGMIIYSPDNENTTNMQSKVKEIGSVNGDVARTIRAGGRGSIDRHSWDLVADVEVIEKTVCEQRKDEGLRFFKNGLCGTLRTIDACGDKRVVEPEVINPLKDKTPYGWHFEQNVYDEKGITRAVKAGGGSGNIPKVINPFICASALTTVQKDNYVCEPQVLRAERTEYGKAIRKQYEAGKVDEKICNMREMKPRTDGISNTITTLLKDNYVAEHCSLRIRKLTPKECWRLMGFDDADFDKASAVNSNSQLYKQAGNSIVVDVLCYIFGEML